MMIGFDGESVKAFKTGWFAKAARKARISDEELCSALAQVVRGQADDLGGGVYKKRPRKNQYRSIVLPKAGMFWVYAKQDRPNIDDDELAGFRKLAKAYGSLTPQQVRQLLQDQDWMDLRWRLNSRVMLFRQSIPRLPLCAR
jgi:hypothetical protein